MADDLVHVTGLSDLQKVLNELPAKLEANILRSALREGAKVVYAETVHRAPAKSGALVASLKIGTRLRRGVATAYVKTNIFYARFIEYGAAAHEIKPKNHKSLFIAGLFREVVEHPGIKPKPFMRTALDVSKTQAVVAAAEAMKTRLATKEGLETGHITIAGDE